MIFFLPFIKYLFCKYFNSSVNNNPVIRTLGSMYMHSFIDPCIPLTHLYRSHCHLPGAMLGTGSERGGKKKSPVLAHRELIAS